MEPFDLLLIVLIVMLSGTIACWCKEEGWCCFKKREPPPSGLNNQLLNTPQRPLVQQPVVLYPVNNGLNVNEHRNSQDEIQIALPPEHSSPQIELS